MFPAAELFGQNARFSRTEPCRSPTPTSPAPVGAGSGGSGLAGGLCLDAGGGRDRGDLEDRDDRQRGPGGPRYAASSSMSAGKPPDPPGTAAAEAGVPGGRKTSEPRPRGSRLGDGFGRSRGGARSPGIGGTGRPPRGPATGRAAGGSQPQRLSPCVSLDRRRLLRVALRRTTSPPARCGRRAGSAIVLGRAPPLCRTTSSTECAGSTAGRQAAGVKNAGGGHGAAGMSRAAGVRQPQEKAVVR